MEALELSLMNNVIFIPSQDGDQNKGISIRPPSIPVEIEILEARFNGLFKLVLDSGILRAYNC